ncbi:MAG: hypothetical protein WCJ35_27285 [Planctomycetota bacterium]
MNGTTRCSLVGFTTALLLIQSISGHAGEVTAQKIPVTSHQIDVGDDPENAYSGAPQFTWPFFGDRPQMVSKYYGLYLKLRHDLGVNFRFYLHEDQYFQNPIPKVKIAAILDSPVIPVIQFALLSNIDQVETDTGYFPAYDPAVVQAFLKKYPNVIFGGGNVAEYDIGFSWFYRHNYGRVPVGPGGRVFPTAFFDWNEALLKRSTVPYMMLEYNGSYGIHYAASERGLSMGCAQLFNRGGQTPVINLVASRSASRQYPYPFGAQYSGQVSLVVTNANAVSANLEAPNYAVIPFVQEPNYPKSYALCRQWLYLTWLNGARFFRWEAGEFIRIPKQDIPSPLSSFTAKSAKFISDFGKTGPVQTPIAIIREFANPWDSPHLRVDAPNREGGGIDFKIIGDSPYTAGDYQMHGLMDFFYPHYIQGGMDVKKATREDFALCITPYGNSVDLLLSDVRKEAIAQYGLLVWGGIPPESPSIIREKLLSHITNNRGRVVLFGAAARSMFPEWFADQSPTFIVQGAAITYGDRTLTESADFLIEPLRVDLDTKKLGMKVLATVGGKPLIVECLGGLVLVLSDYGLNQTEYLPPSSVRWQVDQIIKDLPHKLLMHARQLLADEAARQTLFSVNNENLHYVVTRPQGGEYILGLFNDKLTSEPFHITSHIGATTSLEEIKLDDGKAELKSAAKGAAYAPPGLRESPALPLDYGLSDDQHIEGRDVRLFRIRVQENGVKELPAIRYPSRPANRVLAVAGLEDIRHYLQGMPSFFQWFDGIKVDADALLSVDDRWIVEQAHWLDRRGVRVAVDGSGIDGVQAARVIAKLSLLKRAPKDLIIASPSRDTETSAARAGVHLLAPSAVNRLSQKGQTFVAKAILNILDLYYRSEEDLYCDLCHFALRQDVPALRGKRVPAGLEGTLLAVEGLRDDVCDAGPGLFRLKDFIGCNRTELGRFKYLKIDSTYLLSKTSVALAEDMAVLAGLDIKVIVDMRPDQIHFARIAFYPHIPNYDSGMKLYAEIIDKMKTLGAKDLIIRIQDEGAMRNKEKYIQQRDETWNTFAALAARQGINLHLTFDKTLKFSNLANFSRPNVFVIEGSRGTPSPYVKHHPKPTP